MSTAGPPSNSPADHPTATPDRTTAEVVKALEGLGVAMEADAPLGPKTWYGLGGAAQVLAHPSGNAQLAALVHRCVEAHLPLRVLGHGANLLVSDEGVPGVVVVLDDPSWQKMDLDEKTGIATVGAGCDLFQIVPQSVKSGLDGLVHLAGIPGSVGGAIRMNAGGSFGDIGQTVKTVEVMSDQGQVYFRDRDDLEFAYRSSNILAPFILGASFQLEPTDPEELKTRLKEIWFYKKNTQPISERSAGCCFKNPDPQEQPSSDGRPAGMLIDQAGLKGHRLGSARVSELHANFIEADANGKADDVIRLMDHVKQAVQDRFDVALEREVVVWP